MSNTQIRLALLAVLILAALPTSSRAEWDPPLYPDPESPRDVQGRVKFMRANARRVPDTYSVSLAYWAKDEDVEVLVGDLIARHNACFAGWMSGMSFEIEASLSNARALAGEPQVQSVIEMEESRSRAHRPPVPPGKLVIGTDPVPGRYHVSLLGTLARPTDERVRSKAEALVARHGGRITHVFAEYNLFYMDATEEIARSIAQDPGVRVVHQDQRLYYN